MKKNMFKSMIAVFSAAALFCGSSLSASALELTTVKMVDSLAYESVLKEVSRAYVEGELEDNDAIRDYYFAQLDTIEFYDIETDLSCTIPLVAYLNISGYLTDEETSDCIAAVANGEALSDQVKELLNQDEIILDARKTIIPVTEEERAEVWDKETKLIETRNYYFDLYPDQIPRGAVGVDNQITRECLFVLEAVPTGGEIPEDENPFKGLLRDYLIAKSLPTGDLNASGEPDMIDAVLLSRAVSGTYELSVSARQEADLNGDGEITSADLTLLLQTLAGL